MKNALAAAVLVALSASLADAQVVTYYSPYAPAQVVVAPAPVMVAPVAPRRVVYRPVTPVAVAAPAYAPVSVVAPAVAPVVTTRWRPLLGGTVSRVRYRYAPAAYVPVY